MNTYEITIQKSDLDQFDALAILNQITKQIYNFKYCHQYLQFNVNGIPSNLDKILYNYGIKDTEISIIDLYNENYRIMEEEV